MNVSPGPWTSQPADVRDVNGQMIAMVLPPASGSAEDNGQLLADAWSLRQTLRTIRDMARPIGGCPCPSCQRLLSIRALADEVLP